MILDSAKDALRAPLKVQTLEELLSDMTLKRPDVLALLAQKLNLTDDDIKPDEVKDRSGNVYKFSLIAFNGINRCLLQIPIEISTLIDAKVDVIKPIDTVRDRLKLKFGEDVGLFMIHVGNLHGSFQTFASVCKKLYPRMIVDNIGVEQLIQHKDEPEEDCVIFLTDFFRLDHLPGPVENAGRITVDEITELIRIVAELDAFVEGPRARRVFMEQAIPEFKDWTETPVLDGSLQTVAGELVLVLINRSKRDKNNPLGKFLNYISQKVRMLPTEDKAIIDNVMEKYHLKPGT